MELYLSLSAYGSVSTRQALTVFAEAGVQKVELAIGVKPDADATIAIQGFRQQGMQFRAHHAFVWQSQHRSFNLALPLKMDHFERMADWLAEQAITAYSVHPGHYRGDSRSGRLHQREAGWQLFLANLEKLGSPRIPVEDTRCGLKSIDNLGAVRLLEISYTHEGQE